MAKGSQFGINGGIKMKPSKMRNKMIYHATFQVKSKQLGSTLSKDLRKKYGKRSVRVNKGDSIMILRGESKNISGKVSRVVPEKNSVVIEGVKKEKAKGDKFDIHIHTSNLLVTSLNVENKWRITKLEGKKLGKQTKKTPVKEETREKDTVRETREKDTVRETREKDTVRETREKDTVRETREKDTVRETREKDTVRETREKDTVKETREEETREKDTVKETREEDIKEKGESN